MSASAEDLTVLGATILGFAEACVALNILDVSATAGLTDRIEVRSWQPFERLRAAERIVLNSCQDVREVMRRVGIEMMRSWYHRGPGRGCIDGGVDFLRFQSGSAGYCSVVRGPPELVGRFELLELDLATRRARIHSTTPFDKDMERGVIIGGMSAPGDLKDVCVEGERGTGLFVVSF